MSKHLNCAMRAGSTLGVLVLFAHAPVYACCPSGGVGAPKAATGLGQPAPPTPDLAADPAWQVYELERSGIRYTQIDDVAGNVRAVVGRIDGLFWVLPAGSDADRVALPGDAVPVGTRRVLYLSGEIVVELYEHNGQQRWRVRRP
jgi:hypothetical protein